MISSLALAALGALVVVLARWYMPGEANWLDSGRGVAITALALALLAVPVAAFPWPGQPRSWRRLAAVWFGANIGLIGVLVAFGGAGRNLFPLAVVLQGIVSAIAIAAGSLVGHFLRAAWALVRSHGRDTTR